MISSCNIVIQYYDTLDSVPQCSNKIISFQRRKNIFLSLSLLESKKTNGDPCFDLYGECDFGFGLTCQGPTGYKFCA